MNGWIDVATVLVAGTIATILIIKEVGWKRRYRELEVHMSLTQKERNAWEARAHEVEEERNGLKWQLDKTETAYNMIAKERNTLKLQLDEALKKPVPATDGAVKKPRSRAKPQEKETANDKEA